jgi:hypothetical protein
MTLTQQDFKRLEENNVRFEEWLHAKRNTLAVKQGEQLSTLVTLLNSESGA